MQIISKQYTKRALLWLSFTTALYFMMNGAQIFETALIVPSWTAAPPESLGMFRGEYGLDFKNFWIIFHSIHELTFILALVFCWKIKPVRYALICLLFAHIGVRVWTVAYFAPTIIDFQQLTATVGVDPGLMEKAALWEKLNYLRVSIFIAISLGLIPLVIRVVRLYCDKGDLKKQN